MRTSILVIIPASLLVACATPEPGEGPPAGSSDTGRVNIRVLSEAEVIPGRPRDERRRLIADTLFEGLQALDADRLLTPVDDNAHARFQRVLAIDPDNAIALEGLEDIVLRYVELADEASRQGLFQEAEAMLDRARFVDDEHPEIARAWMSLQEEMRSGDLFFDLDNGEMARRTEAAQQQLADIARQARRHEAFFLITAPNDDLARWMYGIMRDAVAGYRLRGNIEMAGRTSIRLRMPED